MKGNTPAKDHPWRKYKAITNKPKIDKIFSGYAATSKDYRPIKKRGTKSLIDI